MANLLTASRLVLSPLVLWLAVRGDGPLACLALVAAGATDFLDGRVARRTGTASGAGARLDALADVLLLACVAAAVEHLHPEIARDNAALLTMTAVIYGTSIAGGLIAFRRMVNSRQLSSKVAGGTLYAFAVIVLGTGVYEPLLLTLAALVLTISSLEGIADAVLLRRADTKTIQLSGIASSARSHAPHALNEVASNPSAMTSIASVARPAAREILP